MGVLLGVVLGAALVAGCSTAIAGTAAPAPGAMIRTVAPEDISAACPLLAATSVGRAYGASTVHAEEQQAEHPVAGATTYTCHYVQGSEVVWLLRVAIMPDGPNVARGFVYGATKESSDIRPADGIGDAAAFCRINGQHARIDALVSAERTSSAVVGVFFATEAGRGSNAELKQMVDMVYRHFPS